MTTLTGPLIAEHTRGRHSGLLDTALEWLLSYGLTHTLNNEEALAEAALADGLEEHEIAAVLDFLRDEDTDLFLPK